jgi:pyruvate dehydrogenase complex dehydrogenase (E1) component
MNELYTHPEMPVGTEEGIIKGIYQLRGDSDAEVQLLGSGTILREVEKKSLRAARESERPKPSVPRTS